MNHSSAPETINGLSWNIKAGGFADYEVDLAYPVRESKIISEIQRMSADRPLDTLTLIDAYRWGEFYGGDAGIACRTGFKDARFTAIDDDNLGELGPRVGIVFATNRTIQASTELDLGTRKALGVVLDVGKYGLQVANVYLDHIDEERRLGQLKALFGALEPDLPTVIVGDFNSLRPSLREASPRTRLGDLAVRSASRLAPRGSSVRGVGDRRCITYIKSQDFVDADAKRSRPTYPALFPVGGLDYVFFNERVRLRDFNVERSRGASDHHPISFTVEA
jgi:hypothetical protein